MLKQAASGIHAFGYAYLSFIHRVYTRNISRHIIALRRLQKQYNNINYEPQIKTFVMEILKYLCYDNKRKIHPSKGRY